MNQTALQQIKHYAPKSPFARLAAPHGYCFDGDTIHLHAKFAVLDEAAYRRQWLLQLWACPLPPTSTEDLAGEIVAEVALPSMHEIADETEHLEISAFGCPPAGDARHFMALVLATGRLGQFDEIHDLAAYPNPERFLQPSLRGTVGYCIEGNQVRLSAEHIENPRDASSRSGTLALELWALPSPYTGGNFKGVSLAGVSIGSLAGQTESSTNSFVLPFSQPPAGKWHFVLMLREWTASGYATRDFTNFINLVTYPGPATPIAAKSPVGEISLAGYLKEPPAASLAQTSPNTKPPSSLKDNGQAGQKSIARSSQTAAGVKTPVSVNSAGAEDLAAVDGLGPKLARAIIRKRPFASLDDLRRVKGISLKLLNKIRSLLGL